jgi:hypothetical protein
VGLRAIRAVPLLAAVFLSSCVAGAVYQRTIIPLDRNFDETPVFSRHAGEASQDVRHLMIPYVRAHVLWNTNAIGDIARRNGMERVYYADLEFLSIMGIWRQYTVHVYGQ